MSGAIMCFGYGIEFDMDNVDETEIHASELYDELSELIHVHKLYDGYGTYPYKLFFGVKLGEVSEGNSCSFERLAEMLTLTSITKDSFRRMWNDLDPEMREMISNQFGSTPSDLVIWYSQ